MNNANRKRRHPFEHFSFPSGPSAMVENRGFNFKIQEQNSGKVTVNWLYQLIISRKVIYFFSTVDHLWNSSPTCNPWNRNGPQIDPAVQADFEPNFPMNSGNNFWNGWQGSPSNYQARFAPGPSQVNPGFGNGSWNCMSMPHGFGPQGPRFQQQPMQGWERSYSSGGMFYGDRHFNSDQWCPNKPGFW